MATSWCGVGVVLRLTASGHSARPPAARRHRHGLLGPGRATDVPRRRRLHRPMVVITPLRHLPDRQQTSVMTDVRPDQRGVTSGMLNLSRNLGLITGASVIGAVFSLAAHTSDLTTHRPLRRHLDAHHLPRRRSPDRRGARRRHRSAICATMSRDHHRRHATRRAHRLGQTRELVRAEPYVEVKEWPVLWAERAVGALKPTADKAARTRRTRAGDRAVG